MRSSGLLDYRRRSEGGENWPDSECVLNVKLPGLSDEQAEAEVSVGIKVFSLRT